MTSHRGSREPVSFPMRAVVFDLAITVVAILGTLAGYGAGRPLDWTLSFCLLLMVIGLGFLEFEAL